LPWLVLKAQASAPGPLGALGPMLGPLGWPSVAIRLKITSWSV
jgi:hypothetical protein